MKNTVKQAPRARGPGAAARAVLDAAEALAQTRGYNGFSYADIAARLGVTKASLHYHFASKAELGRALIERYHAGFAAALEAIDQATDEPCAKLERYVALYDAVMRNDRMCLCGMLARTGDAARADAAAAARVLRRQRALARGGTRAGVPRRPFMFSEGASERARVLLGSLEGAMLVARSYADPKRFRAAADSLLAYLCKAAPGPSPRARLA